MSKSASTGAFTLSAVELRRLIGTKELSPVELLESCTARIEALNPALNAVTATCFGRARKEAKRAEQAVMSGDELGPLHGLPFGVKDLQSTAGVLTTYGSPLRRNNVPTEDSIMVGRVRNSGGIMVGKTNTPEFGAGANTRNSVWGATGNPFDPMRTCGGSSGGSAAALAVDMTPICTGSDTGGSLRIPAAFCGIVGFRPSPGMVPAESRSLGWTPISVLGPMARNVPDTRLLFESQIGADAQDPLSFPIGSDCRKGLGAVELGNLRVAWSADFGTGIVSKSVRDAFARKVGAMKHHFKQCDELEFDFQEAERCFDVIRAVNFLETFGEIYEKTPELLGPNVRANYEMAAKMSLGDFAWAHGEQTRLFRRFQRIYDSYDIVIAPTVAVSPFAWEQLYLDEVDGRKLNTYYHWLAMAWLITLTTNPAISLPCGTDGDGLPFGLQMVGRFRGDFELLDISEVMEQAFAGTPELARPMPDIEKLKAPVTALRSIVTAPPDDVSDVV
jgi:amidase